MSRVFGGSRFLMAAAKSVAKSAAAKSVAKSAAAKSVTKSADATSALKLKNPGIMKPVTVSPAMENFVGASEISRTEVVKKIWAHIKANQLQNPANKREIRCDDKLKTIFDGRDTIGMLEIARLISSHFLKSN